MWGKLSFCVVEQISINKKRDKANAACNPSLPIYAYSPMCSFLSVHLLAMVIYVTLYCIIHLMHSWSSNVDFFTPASTLPFFFLHQVLIFTIIFHGLWFSRQHNISSCQAGRAAWAHSKPNVNAFHSLLGKEGHFALYREEGTGTQAAWVPDPGVPLSELLKVSVTSDKTSNCAAPQCIHASKSWDLFFLGSRGAGRGSYA